MIVINDVIIQNAEDRIITCQAPSEIPATILVYTENVSMFVCMFSFLSLFDLFCLRILGVEIYC